MTEPTTKDQFEKVFQALRGLQTVQVLSLGLRLKLFATLHQTSEGLRVEALAASLTLHPPYVRIWCETAYAFDLLDVDTTGRYRLPPKLATVLLDADHPRYLGAFIEGFTSYFQADFERYPQAFQVGSVYPFGDHGPAFTAWISRLTHPMQRLVVGRTLPEYFGDALQQGLDVLDMGCGAGELLFKLAETYPQCRLTGVDVDLHGIAQARAEAERRGLSAAITFQHLTKPEPVFTNAFDLVLMFEVLHEIAVDQRPAVLKHCYQALRPGGHLLIVDETWPADPTQLRDPAFAMSVLVQFSELVWGNVVATEQEQTDLLTQAGFTQTQRGDLGGVFTILVAQKL